VSVRTIAISVDIVLRAHALVHPSNLRNAARRLYEYGVSQTDYIQSTDLAKVNQEGYLPVTLGKRRSPNSLEILPLRQSLYRDAIDPLTLKA